MDSRSTLLFDPLGPLSRFESSVAFGGQEPFVKVRGSVDGAKMALWIRVGDIQPIETEVPSRETRCSATRFRRKAVCPVSAKGRSGPWSPTVPCVRRTVRARSSAPPSSRGRRSSGTARWPTPSRWSTAAIPRGDRDAGSPRGKLWVRRDGMVLRQQVMAFRSTLTFVRLPDRESAPRRGIGERQVRTASSDPGQQ